MDLTIDTLLYSIYSTILNPLLCVILTLTLAARSPHWNTTSLQLAVSYSTAVISLRLLLALDARGYFLSGRSQYVSRKLDWSREVVLITGGAGGLGGLIAEIYAIRGVSVAVVDILDETRERVDEWETKGGAYYCCDVGDAEAVQALKDRVDADLGPPTVLINAAAVVAPSPILHLSAQTVVRTYATNLHAHLYTISTFLPGMLESPTRGGTIVTISSVLGQLGCAGLSLYTSSKAATTALHHSFTAELPFVAKSTGIDTSQIRTVLVAPGQLSTPLFAAVTPPSTFFGPVVSVQDLARMVVEKIDAGTGGEISVPLYARWIGWFNVLPEGLRGLVRGWAGLDRGSWNGFITGKGTKSA